MKVNPIAAMFVRAINFDELARSIVAVEEIFDRAENPPEKGADDGEEKKPE